MGLSREVGINDIKLTKGFKELFGTTVFRYLNKLKMDYAKQLLVDENKTIHEAAMILGYSESQHFSKAFKKKFGILPGSFK